MPSDISRRRLLATGGLLGLAGTSGCLDALRGATETTNRQLRLGLSHVEGTLRDEYVYDLAETRPEWDEEAFAAALDGETYTTQYREPFFARDRPKYAEREGTYYRLGSVVVGERTVTHPVLRLTTVGRTDQLDDVPDHVDHSSLPEIDKKAVFAAYTVARARGNEGGVPRGLAQRGGFVYRTSEATDASQLLGESAPTHVEYRGKIYEVAISRETFHEPVYRAEVERVADSPEAMEAVLRARFVEARFDRRDLSQTERSILRDARGDEGYAESHPYSDAYRSLLKRLHRRAYLDGNVEKDAFSDSRNPAKLLYDGEYYDFRLRFVTTEE